MLLVRLCIYSGLLTSSTLPTSALYQLPCSPPFPSQLETMNRVRREILHSWYGECSHKHSEAFWSARPKDSPRMHPTITHVPGATTDLHYRRAKCIPATCFQGESVLTGMHRQWDSPAMSSPRKARHESLRLRSPLMVIALSWIYLYFRNRICSSNRFMSCGSVVQGRGSALYLCRTVDGKHVRFQLLGLGIAHSFGSTPVNAGEDNHHDGPKEKEELSSDSESQPESPDNTLPERSSIATEIDSHPSGSGSTSAILQFSEDSIDENHNEKSTECTDGAMMELAPGISDPEYADVKNEAGYALQRQLDEFSRIDAAKDADELEANLMPKQFQWPAEKPGYIDFTMLNSWKDIEDVIEKGGDSIKLNHVVAAFTRLKQILGRSNTRFLARLAEMIMQNSSEIQPWQIAAVFHACGKLRYKNVDLFESLGASMLQLQNTRSLHSREIANLIYSLGILSRFEVLVKAAEKGVKVADIYHLYSVEPPPVLFDLQDDLVGSLCIELSVSHRLTDFTEQELANTVYGLGLLRYRNTASLKALAREIMSLTHLLKFNAQEVSNILYGFGLLGFQEDKIYEKMSRMMLETDMLDQFTTQHIANVLYGFARVNFSNHEIMRGLHEQIMQKERLEYFREQELSNIITCLSLLDSGTPRVYDALLGEVLKPEKLPRFVEHNLSSIILGLAQARHQNEEALNALAKEFMKPERMMNLTSKELGDIIVGLSGLDYEDADFMQVLACELRKPHRMEKDAGRLWETCRANFLSWSLVIPYA